MSIRLGFEKFGVAKELEVVDEKLILLEIRFCFQTILEKTVEILNCRCR